MGADPAAEEQFGPYLVYERLGVGGMATVHRALERGIEGFERMVALKRLLPHLAEDASFIKSFVREAKLASLLNHVNIVQIFELGRVGTEYFISMEYIDGRDIRRILRHARKVTGPPPINITVGMLLQLCEALDYAHTKVDEEGHPLLLVHRDVSPSNVLVTTQGHLKVIDFGIAKAQSSQLRTQTGRVKGKLAYMAPEAVSGSKDLDARSDIWAVGVIAHELLTARPLFASKNEYQTLLKVQRGDIMPPSTFNQSCPPELDAIVAKALARDADDRFAGAAEMRDALMQLRVKKGMATGYRDISTWVDWAFSIEAPSGGFAATTSFEKTSGSRTPTPRPRRDEDEAVEIAWGGGEQASEEPVLLEDVPDVSEKHLGVAPLLDHAEGRADGDHLDDIPASRPTHGGRTPMPAVRASTVAGVGGPRTTGSFAFEGEPKTNPSARKFEGATDPSASPLVIEGEVDVDLDATPVPAPPTRPQRTSTITAANAVPPRSTPMPAAMREVAERSTPMPAAMREAADTEKNPTLAATALAERTIPADGASRAALDSARIPRTKPGVGEPTRAREPTSLPATDPHVVVAAPRRTHAVPVTIGQAMVEREFKPRRMWPLLLGIGVAGAGALGVTLYVTRDRTVDVAPGPNPKQPQRLVGTVKFVTEPADAEIRIEGLAAHVGSPWATELDAGTHQIEIHRDGFKAWLSSIDLSANETYTVRVALGPLGAQAPAEAMLMLGASSPGLEALIDGKVVDVRTPIKMPIKAGPHAIVLRKDGVEVWRTAINAKAASDYTFDPSFTEAKRIERQIERQRALPVEPHVASAPAKPEPAPDAPPKAEPVRPDDKLSTDLEKVEPPPQPPPPPVVPRPEPKPEPKPIAVVPPPPPPPVMPPQPPPATGPALVAPSAVTKLSGETPHLGVARNVDLPNVVSAKLCIDTAGKVTSAYAITKIEHHAAEDLADVLKTWRYAPYKAKGIAVPACFAVSFRIK